MDVQALHASNCDLHHRIQRCSPILQTCSNRWRLNMTQNEREGIRELSLEDIDGVSGGGSVVGASTGAAGDEYGQAFSGSESVQNTYVTTGPRLPVINAASLHS